LQGDSRSLPNTIYWAVKGVNPQQVLLNPWNKLWISCCKIRALEGTGAGFPDIPRHLLLMSQPTNGRRNF